MNALLGIDRIAEATPWLVETSPWREDPLAIEETIRGFFDAFNGMNYDRCLGYVAMSVDAERGRLIGLLRLARYFSGAIDVQRVTNITISDAKASAVVNAIVRGEATKEDVELAIIHMYLVIAEIAKIKKIETIYLKTLPSEDYLQNSKNSPNLE